MYTIIKMSEVKKGMMVKFADKFTRVTDNNLKEKIMTIRVNGNHIFVPMCDTDYVEVKIK